MTTECKNASAGSARPEATELQAADQLNAALNQAQALLCLLLADGFEHDFASSHQDVLHLLALVLQAASRAEAASRQLQCGAYGEMEDGRLDTALAALQALVRVLINTSIDDGITGPGFASDNAVVLDALMLAADQVEAAQQAAQELQGVGHE